MTNEGPQAAWFSPNYLTFPFYVPRIVSLISNWPLYLKNYLSRGQKPAEYSLRSGHRLIDGTGTLAGTIAVVFVRQEYGRLNEARTIIDIGANMGCFAVYAALACPKAQIYCYEPERRNFKFLTENIAANRLDQRVHAFPLAVAGAAEVRALSVSESTAHSLVIASPEDGQQTVRCTTLGDIIEQNSLKEIDLLKVNCEGAEYEILEKCSVPNFNRIRNIRVEYHNVGDAGMNGKTLASLLRDKGYKIQRFTTYRGTSGFIWASR